MTPAFGLSAPAPVLARATLRPRGGVVAAPIADLRRAPDHKSELVSQALHGEVVRVLGLSADRKWLRVEAGRDRDRGWLRAWSVALGDPRAWDRVARHAVDRAWTGPAAGALPFGARLAVARGAVLGPLGPVRVDRRALARLPAGPTGGGLALIRTARKFLGVAYHWGGRTPAGLDCSGLVQVVLARHGHVFPRDANEQCATLGGPNRLRPLGSGNPPAGALWFFGPNAREVTHVALAAGGLRVIHAYGWVRWGSLDPLSSEFEPELFRSVLGFEVVSRKVGTAP